MGCMENLAIELVIKHFRELLTLIILPFTVMTELLVSTCSLLFGQTDAYASRYENTGNLGQKTEENDDDDDDETYLLGE